MTKEYEKYIGKLPQKQRISLFNLILQIQSLDFSRLDCKKLQGFQNIYRVRHGQWRVVFEKQNTKGIILDINTRGDIY